MTLRAFGDHSTKGFGTKISYHDDLQETTKFVKKLINRELGTFYHRDFSKRIPSFEFTILRF